MEILEQSRISLRSAAEGSGSKAPRSALMLDGRPTGQIVEGAVLHRAVNWNGSTLLFLTDSAVFEECLRIVLLDPDLNILDTATISALYASGTFADLQLTEPDSVSFRFMGDSAWVVTLLSKPVYGLARLSEHAWVRRPFKLTRRFKVGRQSA